MGQIDQVAIELFKAKAKLVSIEITELHNISEALFKAVEICAAQKPHRIQTEKSQNLATGQNILAAPSLSEVDFKTISEAGGKKGVQIIREGMRSNLSGIETTFTIADLAVAETATSILASPCEEMRLATMVCETHIIALPKSKILMDSYQAEDYMRALLGEKAMFAAFISGPSRTADIERVLTIGVHGPVEMHVFLINENN